MLGIRLFPQILADLNFFNVNSEKKLTSRLRAVQRAAAAAIGAYLMARYQPGSTSISKSAICAAFTVGSICLSCPSASLIVQFNGYRIVLLAFRAYENKQFVQLAINIGFFFTSYAIGQMYKKESISPNLLEKLFKKVEDKITQPLWERFYNQ
jgi:hypothetical protein